MIGKADSAAEAAVFSDGKPMLLQNGSVQSNDKNKILRFRCRMVPFFIVSRTGEPAVPVHRFGSNR